MAKKPTKKKSAKGRAKPKQIKVRKIPRCANCGVVCGPKAIASGKRFFHTRACYNSFVGRKAKPEVCEFC